MVKRPAFQVYPADWRKDSALQLCSLEARGLWWEMICLMHEATPYGHLIAAGDPIDAAGLSRLVGESRSKVERLLAELKNRKVFSETDDGVIFSRRMVKDEKARSAWRDRQHKHRDTTRDINGDNLRDVTLGVTVMSPRSSTSVVSSSSKGVMSRDTPTENPVDKSTNGQHRKPGWWSSEQGIVAKGQELGMLAKPGEPLPEFKQRVFERMNHPDKGAA